MVFYLTDIFRIFYGITILTINFRDICPGVVSFPIFLPILILLFLGQFKSYLCFKPSQTASRNLFHLDNTVGFIIFPIYLVINYLDHQELPYFFHAFFFLFLFLCFIFLTRLHLLINRLWFSKILCFWKTSDFLIEFIGTQCLQQSQFSSHSC